MLAGLYRPRALNPCGASRRTGTCVGLVAVPGFEPGCPLGHVLLRDACIRSTRQRDSPCLLVKGADCAGDVLPVWGAVICRSLEAGPCRSALCRVASVGTCCPTYLPRALFSYVPRANRAGVRGSFWRYQTRASDPKWSGSARKNNASHYTAKTVTGYRSPGSSCVLRLPLSA